MKQATLSAIAAYTAIPSSSPPPSPLTCYSTGTNLMQYATATAAASAYCSAMQPRVDQNWAGVVCAIQNKDPPYTVGKYPVCANQADILFQMSVDRRNTDACQYATLSKFSVDSCVAAYMIVFNQCTCKGERVTPLFLSITNPCLVCQE